MGLFEKRCEKCGLKVDGKTAPRRFGMYFCSNAHAEAYASEMEKAKAEMSGQDGDCGCC